MTAKDVGRELSRLIIQAIESPSTVDRGALLVAASHFLDVAQGGDVDGLPLARSMAARAMEWAVLESPENYNALTRAAGIFSMSSQIKQQT
jgi:hypothetical protein